MPSLNRFRRRAAWAAFAAAALAFAAPIARAQGPHGEPPAGPHLAVSGSAEQRFAPTLASFTVGVRAEGATAAVAGEANARLYQAVSEALARAGLARSDIRQSQLVVTPRIDYDDKGRRKKPTTYAATHTITIETEQLARLGSYIDAALGAGATDVSGVGFSLKDAAAARREVLGQAVAAARADAEALARASGGAVGELLYLASDEPEDGRGPVAPMMMASARMAAPPPPPTEIEAGDLTVSAVVHARFRFLPGAAGR